MALSLPSSPLSYWRIFFASSCLSCCLSSPHGTLPLSPACCSTSSTTFHSTTWFHSTLNSSSVLIWKVRIELFNRHQMFSQLISASCKNGKQQLVTGILTKHFSFSLNVDYSTELIMAIIMICLSQSAYLCSMMSLISTSNIHIRVSAISESLYLTDFNQLISNYNNNNNHHRFTAILQVNRR